MSWIDTTIAAAPSFADGVPVVVSDESFAVLKAQSAVESDVDTFTSGHITVHRLGDALLVEEWDIKTKERVVRLLPNASVVEKFIAERQESYAMMWCAL